jgi:E3 ubiquitin-protein ligase RNF1/2
MQTEEIELYKVKDFEPIVIFGDPKLNPNNIKSELLTKEEGTLVELNLDNVILGHLVTRYSFTF